MHHAQCHCPLEHIADVSPKLLPMWSLLLSPLALCWLCCYTLQTAHSDWLNTSQHYIFCSMHSLLLPSAQFLLKVLAYLPLLVLPLPTFRGVPKQSCLPHATMTFLWFHDQTNPPRSAHVPLRWLIPLSSLDKKSHFFRNAVDQGYFRWAKSSLPHDFVHKVLLKYTHTNSLSYCL